MNFLSKMKLGAMLGAGFASVIIIGLMVAILGRVHLANLGKDIESLSEKNLTNLLLIQDTKSGFEVVARVVRNIGLSQDSARIQEEKRILDQQITRNSEALEKVYKQLAEPEARALLEQLTQARPVYLKAVNKAIALSLSGVPEEKVQAALVMVNELPPAQASVFAALDGLTALQKKQTMETTTNAMHKARDDGNTLLLFAAFAVFVGIFISILITRTIKNLLGGEVAYAAYIAQEVAQGNLAVSVDLRPGDNHSVLAAMNGMRKSLSGIVEQVRESSESIATGASEIAAGSTDLSQRTEEQAANLQQTAASMEEISQTVRQNTETVRNATQLAQATSDTAAKGGKAVGNIVVTMKEITDSSRKIGDIISVIDGIAFQTNILALNAAVEAARAGEQGRGFAVVAGEVRSLAQRSASAAKEIKELIGHSVEKVEAGSAMVDSAGATIEELVRQAHNVAGLLNEIGVTTQEQESGVSQIHDAVNQLDQVTQQNAALVEQSASAADSLSDQAARLVELMKVFVVEGGSSQRITPPLKRPDSAKLSLANPKSSTRSDNQNWEQF
ncbi:MCP four helix bundle domain-containing protein [Pectobacterium quasiaquaticum]|uniref:MCP four helix bundle domain-containing protein n=1 Tax=Pectobacterium quasiaquaticum TaxID=2774015 RepID=A0A9Q2IDX0_9GAMM|nr:methyl-accepting chemotaxis protein [Pectobacterium quasiaquaticum]MBE5201884.1 MCP four helix bundle domain-containing protein [Pectobacterium quasiaquaticum]MBE5211345.1 MCP four helix bundle domain-containing protein [Pectobacterium quasiaquaticum]MBE5215439.1 MCP four helix bundle domain-containing protein [Pectobacterium quasiaquaticum]MBE5221097.1 MCP four helix bundle domain-containing protein [Pectobacterium quasiaquaticum]MBE5225004.1 MCP four helix bundle domain-containing protein